VYLLGDEAAHSLREKGARPQKPRETDPPIITPIEFFMLFVGAFADSVSLGILVCVILIGIASSRLLVCDQSMLSCL